MKLSIVIISTIHWHHTRQRHQDIAIGLARKGHDVVYIEPLPKRWPSPSELSRVWGRIIGDRRGSGICLQKEVSNVRVISPLLFPDSGLPFRTINEYYFIKKISKKIASFIKYPLVTINYLPTMASIHLQSLLKPTLKIYDCVCSWAHHPFGNPLIEEEMNLFKSVDVVFADSKPLYEHAKNNHSNCHRILPAVHYDLFNNIGLRRRQISITRNSAICLYFGSINPSIDINLLKVVSKQYKLQIVGPVDGPINIDQKEFGKKTVFFSACSHDGLPKYLENADILLLPYKSIPFTKYVLPAKTFECLATGKPTIAIGLYSLEEFADYFYISNSYQNFLLNIERALSDTEEDRKKRLLFAEEHSWANRIEQINGIIEEALL